MTRATNHAKPRTVALGLAVAFGATLLAPTTAATAAPVATCPATTLTESQLNHLIVDIDGATNAKAASGYRMATRHNDDGTYSEVKTWDAANNRFDVVTSYDELGRRRVRSLSNGAEYELVSTADPWYKPVFAVLGRTSVWVNFGEHEESDDRLRPLWSGFVEDGGTCEQGESGLTLGYVEYGDKMTLVAGTDFALRSKTRTDDDGSAATTSLEYGQFTVPDIAQADRIGLPTWVRANRSATQRAELTSYAKKVAAGAKAAATKAHRAVRATDVKAVKATVPHGTKRALVNTGIAVTTTDAYTRKTLRITVTVAQQTVRIGDNW